MAHVLSPCKVTSSLWPKGVRSVNYGMVPNQIRETVFYHVSKHWEESSKHDLQWSILTKFEGFGNVMEHCLDRLIYHLNRTKTKENLNCYWVCEMYILLLLKFVFSALWWLSLTLIKCFYAIHRLLRGSLCILIVVFYSPCVCLSSLNMESESLEEEESHLIINAVKDANIPKFVAEDLPLFTRILADLFPGLDPPAPDNNLLKVKIV